MKTILKKDDIQRVPDKEAEQKVKNEGWKYVSKTEWKKKHKKPEPELIVDTEKSTVPVKKGKSKKELKKEKKNGKISIN